MKKIISLILSGALILGTVAPLACFAEQNDTVVLNSEQRKTEPEQEVIPESKETQEQSLEEKVELLAKDNKFLFEENMHLKRVLLNEMAKLKNNSTKKKQDTSGDLDIAKKCVKVLAVVATVGLEILSFKNNLLDNVKKVGISARLSNIFSVLLLPIKIGISGISITAGVDTVAKVVEAMLEN